MAAWDCGDSKRLWHTLSKPLSVTYVDGEQPLELTVTHLPDACFEVRWRLRGLLWWVVKVGCVFVNTPHPGQPKPAMPHGQVATAPGQPPVPVRHLELVSGDTWTAEVAGRRLQGSALLFAHAGAQVLTLWQGGKSYEFRRAVPAWSKDAAAPLSAHGALTSPMPGRVIKLLVAEGQSVTKGRPLLVGFRVEG
jgi:biotin carboxyl carrier protein